MELEERGAPERREGSAHEKVEDPQRDSVPRADTGKSNSQRPRHHRVGETDEINRINDTNEGQDVIVVTVPAPSKTSQPL